MQEGLSTPIEVNEYALMAFIGYLLIVSFIGIYTARFSSGGVSEFFIGGRQMNRFVVALSAVVSGRFSWLLLGVTGMAYTMGPSALWAVVGYITAEYFLFYFYARRLRRFSEAYDCITLTDFFVQRFGDKNNLLRSTLVVIILVFMVSYVSAQFVGGGKAFSASFGLDPTSGVIITALIVLVYTTLGGFFAVSLTDMIQAFFMIFALLILPVLAIADAGGWSQVMAELEAFDPRYVNPVALSAGAALGFIGIGLGSAGNPHIIARYMSIKDPEQLKFSAYVGTVWNVLMAGGAIFIGLAGRIYFPENAMLPGADTENLYPALAQHHLHPVLFGIVVASIFAAIMSTADSQLLVAASSIVRDLYENVFKKGQEISQKKLVLLSRSIVVLLVIIATIFGLMAEDLVFWLVLFAWAGLGASIGPASILALYWRKCTRSGIIAGLMSGTIVTILWKSIPLFKNLMYELVPAFVVGFLVTIIVSKLTHKPKDVDSMFTIMEKKIN